MVVGGVLVGVAGTGVLVAGTGVEVGRAGVAVAGIGVAVTGADVAFAADTTATGVGVADALPPVEELRSAAQGVTKTKNAATASTTGLALFRKLRRLVRAARAPSRLSQRTTPAAMARIAPIW
jgi:hypothetical protein